MRARKAEAELRDLVHDVMVALQTLAMSGQVSIPMPQRRAIKGQANALFEQWIELEAARFNLAGAEYIDAADGVRSAIASLEGEIEDITHALNVVGKATSVISTVDKLLNIAVKHLPI